MIQELEALLQAHREPIYLLFRRLKLGKSLGMAAGYPAPLPALGQIQAQICGGNAVPPGAAELARGLFTFPTHSLLTNPDFGRLAAFLRELA